MASAYVDVYARLTRRRLAPASTVNAVQIHSWTILIPE